MSRALPVAGMLALAWGAGVVGPARAQEDDWSLTRPPSSARPARSDARASDARARGRAEARDAVPPTKDRREVLIARYREVLRRAPFDAFAFERLLALHRERDGGLDVLARSLAEEVAREPGGYALLVLHGRVERERREHDAARGAFERAASLDAAAVEPELALAELASDAGDSMAAREALERALARASKAPEKREILQKLAEHALDARDWDAAEKRYAALARSGSGGVHEATTFARALRERGEHARAVAAYERALESLRGDARVLGPVRIELARAQLDAGAVDAAIATLDAAARGIARPSGAASEIDELRLEAHRRQGSLRELVEKLRARGGDVETELLVGRIHDELGDHEAALAALQRVIARRPHSIDARTRVIRLLSREGRLEEVVREYRGLVAVAPQEPRFVIELAEVLVQTGRRDEALAMLSEIGRRNPREARVHRALSELYAAWGEHALATRSVETLSRIEPNELLHWVALGEQYLVQGDRERALATWRKIPHLGGGRAEAHATLAEVYLDHDMPEPAIEAFERAVEIDPRAIDAVRGLAEALERVQRDKDALARWQRVLELAAGDRVARREARRRIVRLWMQTGQLHEKLADAERAFGWSLAGGETSGTATPDLEAGRLLGEAYQVLGRGQRGMRTDPHYSRAAEEALERVVSREPGDVESLLSLEQLRTSRGDVEGAIAVLERLLEADPARARGYLAQMAQHALTLYRDDDALRYAERAVALAADDASAHVRLGDLYRARHDVTRAIASYEKALELDRSLDDVQFTLAELRLSQGETERAQTLLATVVATSPDDQVVERAARWAIQLGLAEGRLEALERSLLQLALGQARRPTYRRLLVELYDAAMQATPDGGVGARSEPESGALGRRAIKPLLEALADPDPVQRRVAVAVLARLADPNAALPLVVAAEADGDVGLRREALLAAGRVAPEALAPRIAAFAEMPEQRLRDAGAWALAGLRGPRAIEALRRLVHAPDPRVRGFALLGLARADDHVSLDVIRRALREDPHAWVRASAALALGWLADRASLAALTASLRAEPPEVAASAALALGCLRESAAAGALAEALFSTDVRLQFVSLRALSWLGSEAPLPSERALPEPELGDDVTALHALALPDAPPDAARSLARFEPALVAAGRVALGGPVGSVESALRLIEGTRPVLLAEPEAAARAAASLAAALRDELSVLVEHPEPAVRVAAVRLLPRIGVTVSEADLARALDDPEVTVRRAALDAAARDHGLAGGQVAQIARTDPRWGMRLRAVRALGRDGSDPDRERALVTALRDDPYAYVREEAARALGRIGAGLSALREAAAQDVDPSVRRAAGAALRTAERAGQGGGRAD